MKPFSIKRIIFIVAQAMGNILVVITYFTYLASENSSVIESKQGTGQRQKLGPSLHGMNTPQRAEIIIRERSFIIIPLSCDSSPKVVFIRHSGFADSNLPRVCLENLSGTPPRGQNRVVDMTD